MPLVPSFSISTTNDPSAIIIVDSSTGSDGAIADRKINIYDVSNNPFGATPYDFPLAIGTTITINPLQKDKALQFILNWVDGGGNVLYTASGIFAFVGYAEQFFSGLTRNQVSQPSLVNDQQYYMNKSKLRVLIDSAVLAIVNMSDVFNAQNCIDLYTPLLQNSTLYF